MPPAVPDPELSQIAIFLTKPGTSLTDAVDWASIKGKAELFRQAFNTEGSDCEFVYFVTQNTRTNPPWLDFINAKLGPERRSFDHHSKSPNGILGMAVGGRLLIAAFGRAAVGALHRDNLEPDFGIKAAMNLCGNEEIRQTRTQSHSVTPTHIDRQTSRPVEAFVFGLSEAEDLKFISAHMKADAKVTLQGRDHLTIKVVGSEKLTWEKLINQCKSFVSAYGHDSYVKLFPNYRNFKAASADEVAKLDDALMAALRAREWDAFDLWIPEFMADDEYSFSYTDSRSRDNDIYSYLHPKQLERFDFRKWTAKTLRNHKVWAYSHKEDRILSGKHWPLYSCFVFEHQLNGEPFLLTDGTWKKIDGKFYSSIVDFVREKVREEAPEPAFLNINIADMTQKKNLEAVFNKEVCQRRPSAILFDRSHSAVGTSRKNKEFCDILDLTDDKKVMRIINCKPFGGGSALSHLFAQAGFYSEAFVSDQKFLDDIRSHIKKSGSANKVDYLKHIKPNQKDVSGIDYRICLWLLYDWKRKPLPDRNSLPLMAKYELKLMHERLQRVFNFREIVVRFVPVQTVNFKTAKAPLTPKRSRKRK